MPVRLCVSIREPTTAKATKAMARAAEWADLVEIRADYIVDLNLRQLFDEKRCPLIFTLRAPQEGGWFSGAERKRLETILEAAQLGADYVDVEFSTFWRAIVEKVPRHQVILSHHDFGETAANLESLLDSMAATGAGLLKIAARARCLADNVRIAQLLRYASSRRIKLCALAMGREGIPSRLLGPLWGSCLAFASLPGGEATADGQIPADVMLRQYRLREIDLETRLYGVLGRPLGHSLLPRVHNVAFEARGLNAVCLPLEAIGMDDFFEFQAEFPVSGVSVTVPYREQVCARADSLSVEADSTGEGNTLIRTERGWHGENADIEGFAQPLRRRMHLSRLRALVLGSGSAALAAVYALRSQDCAVCVAARNPDKARQLAERFGAEHAAWGNREKHGWDLLVNATPLGMYPEVEQTPMRAEWLTGKWVYDLVYSPRKTRLLRDAAARGCQILSGAEMFLVQALKQQQLWCGALPADSVVREALEAALEAKEEQ